MLYCCAYRGIEAIYIEQCNRQWNKVQYTMYLPCPIVYICRLDCVFSVSDSFTTLALYKCIYLLTYLRFK